MKKILFALFLLLSALMISACGSSAAPKAGSAEQSEASSQTNGSSRTLVVVFSHTGHTKDVALQIQKETQADFYEIVPEKDYPKDYKTATDLAKREQEEGARPAIRGQLPDLSKYDTIILGYPIWWYNTPMVVNTFLESYDWSGKTIAPFSTSGGAGIENSVDTIRELAPKAKVKDGLLANDKTKISGWLKEQGLLPKK